MSDSETTGAVANGDAVNDNVSGLKEAVSEPLPATVAPEETNGGPQVEYAPENGDEVDAGEESDEYDFEEEHQAVEGEDDEYVVGEEDYDEGDDGDDGDYAEPSVAADGAKSPNGQKPNLTALLLGDPNTAEDDEEEYDEDEEDDGEEDDYIEESTPITPTSKKRAIEETLDENASPTPEEKGAKKIRS